MSTFQCPSCGGTIEYSNSNEAMTCPFCGTAITTPSVDANATIIAPKVEKVQIEEALDDAAASAKTVIQHSQFKNSAEIMDEVKRSLHEDDKEGAVRIYSKEFNVPLADARSSVDQIEIDMKHSGKEVQPAPEPEPVPSSTSTPEPAYHIPTSDVLDAGASATPPSNNNTTRNIIIGCVALLLLCCLCGGGSTIVSFVLQNQR